MDPTVGLDDVEKRNFLALPGLELRTPVVQCVASHYTDCATSALTVLLVRVTVTAIVTAFRNVTACTPVDTLRKLLLTAPAYFSPSSPQSPVSFSEFALGFFMMPMSPFSEPGPMGLNHFTRLSAPAMTSPISVLVLTAQFILLL
jgi:hypothetical protein